MNTLALRTGLAALALSLSFMAQAQTPRYAPAPKELLQFVLKMNPAPEGVKTYYSCAWLDLNSDGVEEAILWSPSNSIGRLFEGGNRYDGFAVYQKAGAGYKLIGGGLYARDADQIAVLKTRNGKWLDLASYKFYSGDKKNQRDNYWYRCRFGGRGYASEENIMKSVPKVRINSAKAPSYLL